MSSFGWLDYSEHERRRTLDVIELFREKDTRDELGIGTVRDAFADLLFPGTSTIQTRARYFLFIPWIYIKLERTHVGSAQIADRARREEVALIDALAGSEDSDGTVGIDARASLKRLPSAIYWQGLGRLGIRLFHGSVDHYHRSLDRFHASAARLMRTDDGEPVLGAPAHNWHRGMPLAPNGFPKGVSFQLPAREAEYLRDQIMMSAPGSLLAFFVDQEKPGDPVEFPWQHSQYAEFPAHVREQLTHARNFSEAIHGAALLYNLMLGELAEREELVERYRKALADWSALITERRETFAGWNRLRFWEIVTTTGARVNPQTRAFIERWLELALPVHGAEKIAVNDHARQLVHERERVLKRGQARLDNARARELWGGAAGTAQLDYRWLPVVQKIASDIIIGLAQ